MNTNRIDKPVRITSEGLNLLTSMDFRKINELNGFYGKEIFFSDEFAGDVNWLFQALGNLGAHPRSKKLNKENPLLDLKLDNDISIVIISDKIMKTHSMDNIHPFIAELESKLNYQDRELNKVFSYRSMYFLTEEHLIFYINRLSTKREDDILKELIKGYKKSEIQNKKTNPELNLF